MSYSTIRPRLKPRHRRVRPETANHKSQADRRAERLAKLDEIRNRWWKEGKRTCVLCGRFITIRANYTLDHEQPGKMGGCKDDSESNLGPAHYDCNIEKGSKRNYQRTA